MVKFCSDPLEKISIFEEKKSSNPPKIFGSKVLMFELSLGKCPFLAELVSKSWLYVCEKIKHGNLRTTYHILKGPKLPGLNL